jgi:hypothetical protein
MSIHNNNINYQHQIDDLSKKMKSENDILKKSDYNIEINELKKKAVKANNAMEFKQILNPVFDNIDYLQLDQLRDLNIKVNNATNEAEKKNYNENNTKKKAVTKGGITFIGDTAISEQVDSGNYAPAVLLGGGGILSQISLYNKLIVIIIILVLIIIYLLYSSDKSINHKHYKNDKAIINKNAIDKGYLAVKATSLFV